MTIQELGAQRLQLPAFGCGHGAQQLVPNGVCVLLDLLAGALTDIGIDSKPVVQNRYEPMGRKY